MLKRSRKTIVAIALLSILMASSVVAFAEQEVDVYAISETGAEPRWTYLYEISNGLNINQYEITAAASTIAYGNNRAYVTVVVQQKQANGSYEDYVEFSDNAIGGVAASKTLTVPYGTYRVVSYHSAGSGDNMEYKSLVAPDKRVPHDTGK